MLDQPSAQPREEFRMAGSLGLPVIKVGHKPAAEQPLPEPVGDHLRKPLVFVRGDQGGECLAGVAWAPHKLRGRVGGHDIVKRPGRRHLRSRRERHRHGQPGQPVGAARDAAGGRHILRRPLEHRREAEEILLEIRMIGRVVAAGAVHLHRQDSPAEHVGLGCHRGVVLRGHFESGRPAVELAAPHHDKLRHKAVDWHPIEKCLVDEVPERPRVVERRVHEVGVLGEHVLPVARPMVGPAGIGEEGVDEPLAAVGLLVGQKRLDLFRTGHDPADVEREPADEGFVARRRGWFDAEGGELRVDEAVDRMPLGILRAGWRGILTAGLRGGSGRQLDFRRSGDPGPCCRVSRVPIRIVNGGGRAAGERIGLRPGCVEPGHEAGPA